jgi:hypothetical protein
LKLRKKLESLEGELRKAHSLRVEICEDFKRLRSSVETSESSAAEVHRLNASLA